MDRAAAPASPKRRPERNGDQPFLASLFATLQPAPLLQLEPPLRDALLRHQFMGQASSCRTRYPDGRFDLIECSGVPIGRVVTDLSREALTLVDLALLPAWRGRGCGTTLIRSLQDEARAAGVPLRLSVLRSNVAARRFYERLGFAPVGATDTHMVMGWTP